MASAKMARKRYIDARSYSISVTRSSPGQKSLGCADASSTPRTPASALTVRAASTSSPTSASSIALPRDLSSRRVTMPLSCSIRIPLMEWILEQRHLLRRRGCRRAALPLAGEVEPVAHGQALHGVEQPAAIGVRQVHAARVGVQVGGVQAGVLALHETE